jgi:3-phosphoshikimate 1-carboxyvinyltransferase
MTAMLLPLAARPAAVVEVPGSKSVANRMLICAALSSSSGLRGLPSGDDTEVLLAGLTRLGVEVSHDRSGRCVLRGFKEPKAGAVSCGLAGTTSRFLIALAALGHDAITIDGAPPLRRRPMVPLLDALRQLGASISDCDGALPVTVTGAAKGGVVRLRGDVSSQFISALMMIGPRLESGISIELTTDLVSKPYVEMTRQVMQLFGVDGVSMSDGFIRVEPGEYQGADLRVEPDASSASYPLAIAAVTGGTIQIPGLIAESLQGDSRIVEILGRLGCKVTATSEGTTVTGTGSGSIEPFDLEMGDISDLVPTLAVLATRAPSSCRIRGVGFIRAKESNRLNVLATQLSRLGPRVSETEDGLIIDPAPLHGAHLEVHDDHRMAMAFGVLSTVVPGISVDDPSVVSKSWPAYWEMIEGLRA